MKLYFAAGSVGPNLDALKAEGVTRVLVAYPELVKRPEALREYEGLDVFLDCGAWSIASGAVEPFTVHQYIGWLQQTRFPFTAIAALDVIDDGEATRQNYDEMRAAGLDVLPTWHAASSLELAHYYAGVASYIAIGGLASRAKAGKPLPALIDRAWSVFCERHVHLFGVGSTRVLTGRVPYSIDMTGWLFAANHGEVYTLTRWPIVQNIDVTKNAGSFDRDLVVRMVEEMQRFGFSWRELSEPKATIKRVRYNARVLLETERRINLHASVPRSVAC